MREQMMQFLKKNKTNNHFLIENINQEIINNLKYEKFLLYYRGNQKVKSLKLALTIPRTFFLNFNFEKRLRMKLKKWLP